MSVLPCVLLLRLCGPRASPHGPLNQCEHWREVGGSSQNKMTVEPSDVSEVANNSSDVPEQVPGKKRDAAHNKRDASVLENSRH